MNEFTPGSFMRFLSCNSEDEVLEKVKSWSSELSDHDHLIRSTILDIQADLEGTIKTVFYRILSIVLFQRDDNQKNDKAKDELYKSITKMNFSTVYRILYPVFRAYPNPDFDLIPPINDLRNYVAHSKTLSDVEYKGRNPFIEADSLAQVYLDAWAARNALREFSQHMIEEPAALSAVFAKFYRENFSRIQSLGDEE